MLAPTERSPNEVRREQRRAQRMRMLCRALLFCLNHGHAIFMGFRMAAVVVTRIAPFVAKLLVRFA